MDTSSTSPSDFGFNFDNSYLQLPSVFYHQQKPTFVKNPKLAVFNEAFAQSLGLNVAALNLNGAAYLSGNEMLNGAQPIAQAYAGHQFGHFNRLGDGRAILLGEHITPQKQRVDIQLKGAGTTPYSRSGDGRAGLGPMLREYIISEAMHALGVSTTRSLAVTTTGEFIYRNGPSAGAVLTRVAASHLRVGTFQFAAATQNIQQLKALADYAIQRHFSEMAHDNKPYLALLEQVIQRQAALVAQWMQIGFIHGVMNTDNVSICGETIDYGPCAYMNTYHPEAVFSSIDTHGRYAFGNQPTVMHWNLMRFAETLLPLIDSKETQAIELASECLDAFPKQFFENWLAGMRKKLGIFNEEADDLKLVEDLLMYMQKNQADYTNTFRLLGTDALQATSLYQDVGFKNWLVLWQARLTRQKQSVEDSQYLRHLVNPKVIPRNHLVEEALSAANQGEMTLFNNLICVLSSPYAEIAHLDKYTQAPDLAFDEQYQTFCGT